MPEALGGPGVGEAAGVPPARVEVPDVVPASQGEVLPARVDHAAKWNAGRHAGEARLLAPLVDRTGEQQEHEAESGGGHERAAAGDDTPTGRHESQHRRHHPGRRRRGQGREPEADQQRHPQAADERAERLEDVHAREPFTGRPETRRRRGQAGEGPADHRPGRRQGEGGKRQGQPEAGKLTRIRPEGTP
jgi:hypothetical protein